MHNFSFPVNMCIYINIEWSIPLTWLDLRISSTEFSATYLPSRNIATNPHLNLFQEIIFFKTHRNRHPHVFHKIAIVENALKYQETLTHKSYFYITYRIRPPTLLKTGLHCKYSSVFLQVSQFFLGKHFHRTPLKKSF